MINLHIILLLGRMAFLILPISSSCFRGLSSHQLEGGGKQLRRQTSCNPVQLWLLLLRIPSHCESLLGSSKQKLFPSSLTPHITRKPNEPVGCTLTSLVRHWAIPGQALCHGLAVLPRVMLSQPGKEARGSRGSVALCSWWGPTHWTWIPSLWPIKVAQPFWASAS